MGVEDTEEEGEEITGGRVPHKAAAAVPHKAEVVVETMEAVPGVHTTDTGPPDTLTNLPMSPASGTGRTGSRLTSVWSQAPAHGRISSSQEPIIEVLTSSKNHKMTM